MAEHDVVEICAGAGGQSLGLHLAGFRHRLAVELDATAAQTLAANFRRVHDDDQTEVVRVGDVANPEVWRPEDYEGVSLLAGGVPCPPFSVAGKQLGASDERDLYAWAVEAAGQMQPRALLLENVRGLAAPRFAPYRQAVADRLEELGYWSEWRLLHAADFGVPQLRPRFVLVALKPDIAPYWSWPEEDRTDLTVGTVLADLMAAGGWKGAERWAARANGIAPTIVGGSKKHGGADLGPTRAKRAWAELGVDGHGIADGPPPKTASAAHRPRLTNEMVARLQGWYGAEYTWQFLGKKTSVYRQIGNAFPPPVARALGMQLRRALDAQGDPVSVEARRAEPHDVVYRILREADGFVPEGVILERAGGVVAEDELERRIRLLEHDFVLLDTEIDGERAWQLGEFRAFRGQPDHPRQAAFADRTRLSRIS